MIQNPKSFLKFLVVCAALFAALGHANAATIQVNGPLTGNINWRSANEYVLNGFVYVLDGAVLTIEPGTIVRGKPGTGPDSSALIITRGAKIFANGTRAKPIIFTSEADDVFNPTEPPLYARGLWGGICIFGNAVLNKASDSTGDAANPKYDVFETLADDSINGQRVNRYGGNNDNDNSGVMRYCSIRYAGTPFLVNKEFNGLSLCCVGRGTKIENIEVYSSQDDSVEFFGGTVNTKYLASFWSDDDNFDIDQGYRGKNQFWFAIKDAGVTGSSGANNNSGEWNGEPNGIGASNAPLATFEVYNATLIGPGGGQNTAGNRGLEIREFAAPKVYNSIIMQHRGAAIRMDSKSARFVTNGLIDIRDNIWFQQNGGLVEVNATSPDVSSFIFGDASKSNVVTDPMLRSISRTNNPAFRLDPRPQPGSPALSSSRTAPNDGFYTPVAYKGAFDADDLWMSDWTYASEADFLRRRPDILFEPNRIVDITGNLTGTHNWYRTNTYVLDGFVYLLAGGVLNIEPGTVVRGKPGTGPQSSALIITRGARIFARGTAHSPIVFTSESDDLLNPTEPPLYARGLWGGICIFGNAVLNKASDSIGDAANPKYDVFETLADNEINGQRVNRYGGNNDNDNSGVMTYCSIRYAGTPFLVNKEFNGLSLCCVGRGTTIENIEVYSSQDDSVEFFGSTVNTKYLASFWSDDDNFDIDQGFRGKNQFWFAIKDPGVTGSSGANNNSGEWNGEPNGIGASNAPLATFEVYNATLIGPGGGQSTAGNRGLEIREFAAPRVHNSIIMQHRGAAIRMDSKSARFVTNGLINISDNIWFQHNGGLVEVNATSPDVSSFIFGDTSKSNVVTDPMLRSISRTNNPAFGLDPRPQAGSPALSSARTAPNDGFYTPVAYKGAFNDVNWASDWGYAAEACIITGEAAGQPASVVLPCSNPALAITRSGGNVNISFTSQSGFSYQVESSVGLDSGGNWGNEGTALAGTGGTLNYNTAAGSPQKFFRVRCLGQ